MKIIYLIVTLLVFCVPGYSTNQSIVSKQKSKAKKIITGAEQPEQYLPYLRGKRVGILANPTTITGKVHLVDFLLANGINIVKVFGPEHGFRGNASAGVEVTDEKDAKTGIKIISLYGRKRKPSAEDMADID